MVQNRFGRQMRLSKAMVPEEDWFASEVKHRRPLERGIVCGTPNPHPTFPVKTVPGTTVLYTPTHPILTSGFGGAMFLTLENHLSEW